MEEIKKMLRAVINTQTAHKEELMTEIKKLDTKLEDFRAETKSEFKKVHSRIDKIGISVARLEDDTPTREEFEELERFVGKTS